MGGINAIMNIARGALQANQIAMEVVSHNIANVNTPGYTRQSAVLESASPVSINQLKIGTGVQVGSVAQASDPYTTRAIQQNTSSLNEYQTEASVLSQLESLFNETGNSTLSNAMNEFWNGWQDVANNPGGTVERTALLEKANILTQKFNSMSNDLTQTKKDMNTNLQMGIEKVNELTGKIADLNDKIVAAEADKIPANDLRDQRNSLLGELSSWLGNVSVEQGNGSVTVLTQGGNLLVDGNNHWDLQQSGNNIYYNNVPNDISKNLTGGQIGGWLDIQDEVVPQYQANLDELAGTLIRQVNALHSTGYTLSGQTGKKFFDNSQVPISGDNMGASGYIQLSTDVLDNPANIAAGSIPPAAPGGSSPGDNENALKIVALQTDSSIQIRKWTISDRGTSTSNSPQTETTDDYYRTLVGEIGTTTEAANENQSFVQSTLDNLQNVRDSVSGVNLDEELTELLKIQRAYEASSKIISIADEMLQSLLQMV
jgi:flagellar hook-associated protein 1 FlgK